MFCSCAGLSRGWSVDKNVSGFQSPLTLDLLSFGPQFLLVFSWISQGVLGGIARPVSSSTHTWQFLLEVNHTLLVTFNLPSMPMAPYFENARKNLDVGVYHQADEKYAYYLVLKLLPLGIRIELIDCGLTQM